MWVSREWREDVQRTLEGTKQNIAGLRKMVERLDRISYCDHSDTRLVVETSPFSLLYGLKQCAYCKQIFEKYKTEAEFLAAKIAHEEAIVSRDAKRLKELKK